MFSTELAVHRILGCRMEFEEFKANYDRVELCNLTPDSLTEETKKKWNVNILEGSWIRGSTAGGCRNYIGTEQSFNGNKF